MPWSAGTFTRTYGSTGWQGDAAAGTPIVADRHDTNDQDLATGINACLNKDGTNSMAANLNMGGFIPTNLGAGTAAAPAICAGNDQDTGMYSPAANQIGIATNGAERIRVNASGNLGIGTTSPGQMLDIGNGSSPAGLGVRLNGGTGNDSGGGVFFANSSTNNSAIGAYSSIVGGTQNNALTAWAGTGNEIRFITNGGANERMRITSTGLVGIATQSPSARLTVAGALPDAAGGATNPGTIQLNEQSITNFTTTGGLEFKGSASGSGYGSKLLGFDNGSLVFLYRNNSATWTESARLDNSGFFSARGSKDRTTAIAANCHIDSTDGGIYRSTSSIKYKTDVADYTKGLEELKTLRPVTYKGINNGDITFAGLIAEEVHDAGFAEFVMYNSEQEPEGLAYGNMIALAVKAIKELSDKVDALTERVEALEA